MAYQVYKFAKNTRPQIIARTHKIAIDLNYYQIEESTKIRLKTTSTKM